VELVDYFLRTHQLQMGVSLSQAVLSLAMMISPCHQINGRKLQKRAQESIKKDSFAFRSITVADN